MPWRRVLRQHFSKRRSPTGQRELLRCLHTIDESWTAIFRENRGRMSSTLRDAVLGSDSQMFANGCQAILWFREYDLMPALINASEDEANPNSDTAAKTIVELSELLYQELAGPRDYQERRDPQLVRKHVVSSLELSVKRYTQHKRDEIIESFLTLTNRDNAVLKKILTNPRDGSYMAIVSSLTHSTRTGVIRLALSFLDDPGAPSTALNILVHRAGIRHLSDD